MKTINERVKYVFSVKNIKQTQLAKELNKSKSTVSGYFSGTYPSEELITYMLKNFKDMSARWLFSGAGEPFPEEMKISVKEKNLLNIQNLVQSHIELEQKVLFLEQEILNLKENQQRIQERES